MGGEGKCTSHGCVFVPVVWTACPDSRSTSCRQWRCWWDCERSASPAHSHSTPGAADTHRQMTENSVDADDEDDADEAVFVRVYRVSRGRERRPLHRGAFVTAVVPQDDLPRVRASNHQIRMKLCKHCWHHCRLNKHTFHNDILLHQIQIYEK